MNTCPKNTKSVNRLADVAKSFGFSVVVSRPGAGRNQWSTPSFEQTVSVTTPVSTLDESSEEWARFLDGTGNIPLGPCGYSLSGYQKVWETRTWGGKVRRWAIFRVDYSTK